jgi:hypothetical protein
MREYESVYRLLGLPASVINCALGRITIPIVGWDAPADWRAFPPALIPLASDRSMPSCLGYWNHWFSVRHATFVELHRDSGLVLEIARTPEQLFCYLAITAMGVDDGITPALQGFADVVGIDNLPEIDAVSLKTGDNPLGFCALPQFAADLPLNSVKDARYYAGDFPTGLFAGSREWWHDCCSFEVSMETSTAWPDAVPRPRWMLPGPKARIFDDFYSQGDYRSAWLTLNSSGWPILEAKAALSRLAAAANDPVLTALASAWFAVADPSAGGY